MQCTVQPVLHLYRPYGSSAGVPASHRQDSPRSIDAFMDFPTPPWVIHRPQDHWYVPWSSCRSLDRFWCSHLQVSWCWNVHEKSHTQRRQRCIATCEAGSLLLVGTTQSHLVRGEEASVSACAHTMLGGSLAVQRKGVPKKNSGLRRCPSIPEKTVDLRRCPSILIHKWTW